MIITLLIEYDNPKNETRWNKIVEIAPQTTAFWGKHLESGDVKSVSNWADNTNHLVIWVEFEDTNGLAKYYEDEEFHKISSEWVKVVDNASVRILRPAMQV